MQRGRYLKYDECMVCRTCERKPIGIIPASIGNSLGSTHVVLQAAMLANGRVRRGVEISPP